MRPSLGFPAPGFPPIMITPFLTFRLDSIRHVSKQSHELCLIFVGGCPLVMRESCLQLAVNQELRGLSPEEWDHLKDIPRRGGGGREHASLKTIWRSRDELPSLRLKGQGDHMIKQMPILHQNADHRRSLFNTKRQESSSLFGSER